MDTVANAIAHAIYYLRVAWRMTRELSLTSGEIALGFIGAFVATLLITQIV